jgi:hypothetical protein
MSLTSQTFASFAPGIRREQISVAQSFHHLTNDVKRNTSTALFNHRTFAFLLAVPPRVDLEEHQGFFVEQKAIPLFRWQRMETFVNQIDLWLDND